ncbi:unnamed protein product [Moneuplotes crassus]|uniref:Uncharacterized protein n=1 Tax=Euplotes crassus TaxID=5936 RepID=A0AAD1UHQ4_EUPCR|nr:unnamed protein product [Moneuplotes crassus]
MEKRTQSLAFIRPRPRESEKSAVKQKDSFLPSFNSKTPKLTPFQRIKLRKNSGRKVMINRNFSLYKQVKKFKMGNKFPRNLSIKKARKMLVTKKANIAQKLPDKRSVSPRSKPVSRPKYSISRYVKEHLSVEAKQAPRQRSCEDESASFNFYNIKIKRKPSKDSKFSQPEIENYGDVGSSLDQYTYHKIEKNLKNYDQSSFETTSRNQISLGLETMPRFTKEKSEPVQLYKKRGQIKKNSVDYTATAQSYLQRVKNKKKLYRKKGSLFNYPDQSFLTQENLSAEKNYTEAQNWKIKDQLFNDKRGRNLSFSKCPPNYGFTDFQKESTTNDLSSDGMNFFANLKLIGDFQRPQGKSFFVSKNSCGHHEK